MHVNSESALTMSCNNTLHQRTDDTDHSRQCLRIPPPPSKWKTWQSQNAELFAMIYGCNDLQAWKTTMRFVAYTYLIRDDTVAERPGSAMFFTTPQHISETLVHVVFNSCKKKMYQTIRVKIIKYKPCNTDPFGTCLLSKYSL